MCCLAKGGGSRFAQINCRVTFIALDCKIQEDFKRYLSNCGEQIPYDVVSGQEDTDCLNGKECRGRAVFVLFFLLQTFSQAVPAGLC